MKTLTLLLVFGTLLGSISGLAVPRRVFLDATLVAGASAVVPPAFADGATLDDLAMPDEPVKDAEAAMAEKLKRKAELQKKASQPRTFTDSFKNEMAKKEEFKKQSTEERRNALCEELGRGC